MLETTKARLTMYRSLGADTLDILAAALPDSRDTDLATLRKAHGTLATAWTAIVDAGEKTLAAAASDRSSGTLSLEGINTAMATRATRFERDITPIRATITNAIAATTSIIEKHLAVARPDVDTATITDAKTDLRMVLDARNGIDLANEIVDLTATASPVIKWLLSPVGDWLPLYLRSRNLEDLAPIIRNAIASAARVQPVSPNWWQIADVWLTGDGLNAVQVAVEQIITSVHSDLTPTR